MAPAGKGRATVVRTPGTVGRSPRTTTLGAQSGFYLWIRAKWPAPAEPMQRTAFLLGIMAVTAGCSTDLDINAPYKDITVVHGLLNMRDSIQYIKINKAFLGEGDAYLYAQIQDSNEWAPEAIEYARVVRKLNGNVVSVFPLRDTLITDRDPGMFYSPEQTIYYFWDTIRRNMPQGGVPTIMHLDQNSDYELQLRVKGQDITATTNIVNDFSFSGPDQNTIVNTLNLYDGNHYQTFELNWDSNRDGKRYIAEYRFNYKEVVGTDTVTRSFTRRLGTDISSNPANIEPMIAQLLGAEFYAAVASEVGNAPVDQRIFTGIDFIVSVANEEFHTYLTLSEPVSGIVQDRPAYSNVNNGYGIFGGRYNKYILGKRLNSNSLNELADGPVTGALRFCSNMPGDNVSPHFCP